MGQATNQFLDGMDVYDWDGAKIGVLVRYDPKLGYLETEGTFTGPRYIPFWAVERVGPRGAYLNVSAATVKELYQHMPKVTPDVSGGKLTGSGKVASGYTGRPVPLDPDGLSLVRKKITIGSKVFDADGKNLGTIERYDADTGYMRIEKGKLFPKDLFLPDTAISYLDEKGVHLAQTKDSIVNHFVNMPEVAQDFFAH